MKKTYIAPGMTEVRLQYQGLLMQSVQSFSSNLAGEDAISYGGDSGSDTSGQGARTKEFGSVWDEEW